MPWMPGLCLALPACDRPRPRHMPPSTLTLPASLPPPGACRLLPPACRLSLSGSGPELVLGAITVVSGVVGTLAGGGHRGGGGRERGGEGSSSMAAVGLDDKHRGRGWEGATEGRRRGRY